jgi:hypothetical protein
MLLMLTLLLTLLLLPLLQLRILPGAPLLMRAGRGARSLLLLLQLRSQEQQRKKRRRSKDSTAASTRQRRGSICRPQFQLHRSDSRSHLTFSKCLSATRMRPTEGVGCPAARGESRKGAGQRGIGLPATSAMPRSSRRRQRAWLVALMFWCGDVAMCRPALARSAFYRGREGESEKKREKKVT